jgi:hypothetical protein
MPKRSTKTTATRSKTKADKAKKTKRTSKTQTQARTQTTRRATTPRPVKNETTVFSTALQNAQAPTTRTSMHEPSVVTTFSQLMAAWVAFFLASTLLFYLVNLLFPQYLVFGTDQISSWVAMLQSSALLSLLVVGAIPIIEMVGSSMGRKISDSDWMVIYLLLNTIGIWLISRFAEVIGLGISSWVVALVVGFILNLAQGIIYKMLISRLTSRGV